MPQNILCSRGWLSLQPQGFRDEVLAAGRVQKFADGNSVFGIGDPPGGAYGLISGRLALSIAPRTCGPHLVHHSTTGAWLGEGSYLTGQPRRIGIEAVGEAILLHLPLDEMERLSAQDRVNIKRFGQIAMLNIDSCFHAMNDLLIPDPRRRLAAVLIRCAGDKPSSRLATTQSELGQIANVSRKVVNQSVKILTELGLIRTGYASIEVLDAKALECFAYEGR